MRTRMYGGVRGQGLAAPTYSIYIEAVWLFQRYSVYWNHSVEFNGRG